MCVCESGVVCVRGAMCVWWVCESIYMCVVEWCVCVRVCVGVCESIYECVCGCVV